MSPIDRSNTTSACTGSTTCGLRFKAFAVPSTNSLPDAKKGSPSLPISTVNDTNESRISSVSLPNCMLFTIGSMVSDVNASQECTLNPTPLRMLSPLGFPDCT